MTIFTIGHSNHPLPKFIGMLKSFDVNCLVDVRTIPRSHTNPQFNKETLPEALRSENIAYRHIIDLGGKRPKQKSALYQNTLWENTSFRNYADYATTPEFLKGLNGLVSLAAHHTCAIMCAEAVWWRCHRRIISDYLLAIRIPVKHIMSKDRADPAKLTEGAHIVDHNRVAYIAPQYTLDVIN